MGVDIPTLIADSLRCIVETNNTVKQLHPNLKKKKIVAHWWLTQSPAPLPMLVVGGGVKVLIIIGRPIPILKLFRGQSSH